MTDSVLKSILRLFAILSNVKLLYQDTDKDTAFFSSRKIVNAFLAQVLNPEKTARYIQIFDFHCKNIYKSRKTEPLKRISLLSTKLVLVCRQINDQLDYTKKMLLLMQLLDILKDEEGAISDKLLDTVATMSEILHISADDFDKIFFFVFGSLKNKARNNSFLIIYGENPVYSFRHFLHRENLQGFILVFYHENTQSYFFRHEQFNDMLTLNGRPIEPYCIYILEKGYAIRSPKIQTVHFSDIAGNFLYRHSKSEIKLIARDIEFRFGNSSNGIHKFSFVAQSGQLIAIMGGSGVGKSTLLNILNGNMKPQSGNVFVSDVDIYAQRDKAIDFLGFVPQDDLLVEELSVFENLYYNVKLCFGNLTDEEATYKALHLLTDLNLNEIANLKVGNALNKYISGGQRKRLNIALELLREPAVLFADEPTSGLSSKDSLKVMELLKNLTYHGKIVIVNIHQPSSDIFKMFDRLLVLDKGGYPVYFGNTTDSLAYFKNVIHSVNADENECLWCGTINPEEILEIIEHESLTVEGFMSGKREVLPEKWYELFLKNQTFTENDFVSKKLPQNKNGKKPSVFRQFYLFLNRNIHCKLRDSQYILVTLFEAPLLAVILSFFTRFVPSNGIYTFAENLNVPAFIFMSVVVALFLGMMSSAEEIIHDARQRKRESFINLSNIAYFNSKVVYAFMLSAIQMGLFVAISHWILEIHGMFFQYWFVLFSVACFANMLSLNLSSGLKSVVTIYIAIPLLLIPQLLLSGTIVKYDKLHPYIRSDKYVPFIGDVMTSRWAYEALMVEQFVYNRYGDRFYQFELNESNATYCNNYWIPEVLNRLDICFQLRDDSLKIAQLTRSLKLISNELVSISKELKITPFKYDSLLIPSRFDSLAFVRASNYVRHARDISVKILNNTIEKKDDYTQRLILREFSNDEGQLVKFKNRYFNQAVADEVLGKTSSDQIAVVDNCLIRKFEPVFNFPKNNFGRAHYFAPAKKIGNWFLDTFYFNIIVIWLMVAICYVCLVTNVLKRFMDRISFEKSLF
ncbi:MAG TPA: ATP-binding cassette domain-containing protein [Bacteroidales bacterium]|nr:ATP-binding cassette domain-containing protein [Bacteroidales bacterium]